MMQCQVADRWFQRVADDCEVAENTLAVRIRELMEAYYGKNTV